MAYQNGSLPRPLRNARPSMPVVPVARVRPGGRHRLCDLERELALLEQALRSASRDAARWKARARALEHCLGPEADRAAAVASGPASRGRPRDLSSCLAVVCAVTGEAAGALAARGRARRTAKARHILFWLLRRTTSLGLAAIGEPLGRDHATVAHGINRCAAAALALGLDREPDDLVDAVRSLWEADWCKVGSRVDRAPSRGRRPLAEAARIAAEERPAAREGEGGS
jgi:Bacterial dnaA protein helix-turn-helix